MPDHDPRSAMVAGAGRTLGVVSLAWPILVAVGLELALRLAPALDPQVKGAIDIRSGLALARLGGREGYVVVGELYAWLAVGIVVSMLALATARRRGHRILACIGGVADLAGITYASGLRF